jgi:hypothetical protein
MLRLLILFAQRDVPVVFQILGICNMLRMPRHSKQEQPPVTCDYLTEKRSACQKCQAFLSTLRNLQVSDEMAVALP